MLRKIIDRVNDSDERIEVELVEPENFNQHHVVNFIEEIDDNIVIWVKDFGRYIVKSEEVVVDESLGKCIKVKLDTSLDESRFYARDGVDPYFNRENYDPEDDFNYDYLLQIKKIVEVDFIDEIEKGGA